MVYGRNCYAKRGGKSPCNLQTSSGYGVEDTFTGVPKDEIDDFHGHLKKQSTDIQFTKEIEENGI